MHIHNHSTSSESESWLQHMTRITIITLITIRQHGSHTKPSDIIATGCICSDHPKSANNIRYQRRPFPDETEFSIRHVKTGWLTTAQMRGWTSWMTYNYSTTQLFSNSWIIYLLINNHYNTTRWSIPRFIFCCQDVGAPHFHLTDNMAYRL